MSKLSIIEEVGRITSHDNKCACGRIITRASDRTNGICRLCNPFSLKENPSGSTLNERTEQALKNLDYHVMANPLG